MFFFSTVQDCTVCGVVPNSYLVAEAKILTHLRPAPSFASTMWFLLCPAVRWPRCTSR
jgi:hypothetical protein